MKPTDIDADTEELLDQIHEENQLRLAYIAGVGKGLNMALDDSQMLKSDFHTEIREGFREWYETEYES